MKTIITKINSCNWHWTIKYKRKTVAGGVCRTKGDARGDAKSWVDNEGAKMIKENVELARLKRRPSLVLKIARPEVWDKLPKTHRTKLKVAIKNFRATVGQIVATGLKYKSVIQTAAGPACGDCGRGIGCWLSADESPCQCK